MEMTYEEKIVKIHTLVEQGDVVFFGGAGVSTSSGMKDFRSKDGLYNEKNEYRYPPETILSHDFFYKKPEIFYKYYREKMNCLPFEPNIVHRVVADWERKGFLNAVITQNVDDLHQKAGSKNVIELHGTEMKNFCSNKKCLKPHDVNDVFYGKTPYPTCSECGRIVKPGIVLYGEQIMDYEKAIAELQKAKTLIIAGCSLTVFPAADLVQYFYGDNLIIINRDTVPNENWADIVIHDDMKDVFEKLNTM